MTSRAENLRGGKDTDLVGVQLEFALPDEPIFQRIRIVGEADNQRVVAHVLLDDIHQEATAVRTPHVQELAENMRANNDARRQKNGQIEPILVAHIPGLDEFLIVNGFHRNEALRLNGETEAFAIVMLNSTIEEVRDLRILTTKDQAEVEFARRIAWMQESWEDTQWRDKITAAQAFGLANSVAQQPGKGLGLDADEAEAIITWCNKKAQSWNAKPAAISRDLFLAEDVDPELIQESRVGEPGAVSPKQLGILAKSIHGKEYFGHQRVAVNYLKQNRLSNDEIAQLGLALAMAESPEKAQEVAQSGRWRPSKNGGNGRHSGGYITTTARPHGAGRDEHDTSGRVESHEGSGELVDIIFYNELELARQSLEIAVLRGRYTPPLDRTAQGNFGIFQANAVPLEFGLNGHSEWSDEAVGRVLSRSEQIQPQVLEFITRRYASIEPNTAAKVYNNAVTRIISDTQKGILRMFPLEDHRSIDQAIVNAVNQEATHYARAINTYARAGGQLAPMPSAEIADEVSLDEPIEEYSSILKDLLSSGLVVPERRALVLGGVFNLPTTAIASVMGQHPNYIEAVIKNLKLEVELKVEAVLDGRR